MQHEKRTNTTHLALRYEADFVSHLEERLNLSRGTARALLESWMQGLDPVRATSDQPVAGPAQTDTLDPPPHGVDHWLAVGLERVASAETELYFRRGAQG
jgi:hypothetical protein